MNPAGRGVDDELVNLGLIFLIGLTVLGGVLRLAGTLAARVTLTTPPTGGVEAGGRSAGPGRSSAL